MPGGYLNKRPLGMARRYRTRAGAFTAISQPRSPFLLKGRADRRG